MRIAVLTDSETAAGYRLAGLDVRVAQPGGAAREALASLLEGEYALIVVDEALMPDPYHVMEREMRGRELPLLLPAPPLAAVVSSQSEDVEGYMRQLVKETMGYEIKL